MSSECSKTFSSSSFLNNTLLSKGEEILTNELEEKLNLENIEINSFFAEEDVTENILKKQLAEYEEKSKNIKNDIALSMVDYIKMKINQIKSEKCEIFSNSEKIKNLKKFTALNGKENSDILIDTLIKNYKKLTDFIDEVLIKLKENINSMPYTIKALFVIIDILFNKKYSKKKPKDITFQHLMTLSNYLVGSIILQ